ncbi:MAG: hypothetical protein H6766_06895 [Candidatus Peribacteria bacterium]|nr:MAG: hypothetical protein H6766_06895 [Candidatus Peribacteria bacterium]
MIAIITNSITGESKIIPQIDQTISKILLNTTAQSSNLVGVRRKACSDPSAVGSYTTSSKNPLVGTW